PDDEIAVNADAQLPAVPGERASCFDSRTFLDVLQNLIVARFEADDEEARSCIRHRLQRLVVAVHTRSAGPAKLQRPVPATELWTAILPQVERGVSEEEFPSVWKELRRLFPLTRDVVLGPDPPGVPRQRLRPQTKGAQRRAAARGVERHVGMQEERYVVLG